MAGSVQIASPIGSKSKLLSGIKIEVSGQPAKQGGCNSSSAGGKASCGSAAGAGDLDPEIWEKVKNHPCYSE